MIRFKHVPVCAGLAAALVFFAAPADAQLRPWEISIAGGPSFPTSDLDDVAGTGYHVQGSIGFGIPLFPLGLRGDVLWQEVPHDVDGNFRQIGGIANATLGMPLILIEPYVLGGIGVFSVSAPDTESETTTGFNVGAGLEAGLLGLKGFVEARYLDAGNRHRTIPLTVGIRF